MEEKLVTVRMIRENLENIPQYDMPSEFSARFFRPGDDKTWVDVVQRADSYQEIDEKAFFNNFGEDLEALEERMYFLCDDKGNEIGTATAWYNSDSHSLDCGRVHWVAIVPAMQGKGLAKPLMTVVCNRFKELGYKRACLTTEHVRLPAISLYLKFGFVPEIRNEKDARVWENIRDAGLDWEKLANNSNAEKECK